MRLCLIALPWSVYERPSGALGALAAFVRREAPEIDVICRSEFVEVALAIGPSLYEGISLDAYDVGELLYMPQLYPERTGAVREYFARTAEGRDALWRLDNERRFPSEIFGEERSWEGIFDTILGLLGAHLDRLAAEVAALSPRPSVVGLTTCFGQLFANLAFARRLKEIAPEISVVLGGSTVSSHVGTSLLREYPFVDHVVQGEGEQPLLALLRRIEAGARPEEIASIRGLVTRAEAASGELAALWEVPSMDALPLPDYDEYAAAAERAGFVWLLSVEGSRGCWWDRTKRRGNPKATCHFCNLNVQWEGYREKSTARLVDEVARLSDRYAVGTIFFLDNIIRAKGVEELARSLAATGRDLTIFYEMRANVSSHEILLLWQAGVRWVQFGIEALSTSMLKRIGKGTTTILNLQAMKTCHELGIRNNANLITDYPGSRPEEVKETVETILRHALAYEPLSANRFWLGRGATVEVLREQFPVASIRNADFYAVGLPEEVYQRLHLFDLSYEITGEVADWTPVREACALWREAYSEAAASEHRHLMAYFDGVTFTRIYDARSGSVRSHVLRGIERDLYMFCAQIRTVSEVEEALPAASLAQIEDLLGAWEEAGILYREGSRVLALAPAFTPEMAARRISAAYEADRARATRSGRVARLPLLDQGSAHV